MTATPRVAMNVHLSISEYEAVAKLAQKYDTTKIDIVRRAIQALMLAEGGLE